MSEAFTHFVLVNKAISIFLNSFASQDPTLSATRYSGCKVLASLGFSTWPLSGPCGSSTQALATGPSCYSLRRPRSSLVWLVVQCNSRSASTRGRCTIRIFT